MNDAGVFDKLHNEELCGGGFAKELVSALLLKLNHTLALEG